MRTKICILIIIMIICISAIHYNADTRVFKRVCDDIALSRCDIELELGQKLLNILSLEDDLIIHEDEYEIVDSSDIRTYHTTSKRTKQIERMPEVENITEITATINNDESIKFIAVHVNDSIFLLSTNDIESLILLGDRITGVLSNSLYNSYIQELLDRNPYRVNDSIFVYNGIGTADINKFIINTLTNQDLKCETHLVPSNTIIETDTCCSSALDTWRLNNLDIYVVKNDGKQDQLNHYVIIRYNGLYYLCSRNVSRSWGSMLYMIVGKPPVRRVDIVNAAKNIVCKNLPDVVEHNGIFYTADLYDRLFSKCN